MDEQLFRELGHLTDACCHFQSRVTHLLYHRLPALFSGQIELYTHVPVMKQLIETLQSWDFRVCGVFLIDAQFMIEASKFISGT